MNIAIFWEEHVVSSGVHLQCQSQRPLTLWLPVTCSFEDSNFVCIHQSTELQENQHVKKPIMNLNHVLAGNPSKKDWRGLGALF